MRDVLDVTVIVPTRNRPQLLRQTLASIQAQTVAASAVLVVDDGEGGADIASEFNYACVDGGGNGAAAAMNLGVAHATTAWVAFLADDDLWHHDFLKRMSEAVRTGDSLAFNSPAWWFGDTESALPGYYMEQDFVASTLEECHARAGEPRNDQRYMSIHGFSRRALLGRNCGNGCTTFIDRATFIRAGGFPVDFWIAEDWLFYHNVSRFTEWKTVPSPSAFIRIHGSHVPGVGWRSALVALNAMSFGGNLISLPEGDEGARDEIRRAAIRIANEQIWPHLRRGRVRMAWSVYRFAAPLLRGIDRFIVFLPRRFVTTHGS